MEQPLMTRTMDPPIRECDEPLIDVRKDGKLAFGPPPECPETAPHYGLMRVGVYRKILRAQSNLQQGLRFRLYEGLRSLEFQAKLFDEEKARVSGREPHLSPADIHERATLLVSPVLHFDGSKNTPPHSTGGAVDLEIIDAAGAVIDFGMEIKDWTSVAPEFCAPTHPMLGQAASDNRGLLARVLLQQGFVRFESEWWHFSYGDPYWARNSGHDTAMYGSCTTDMISNAGQALSEYD